MWVNEVAVIGGGFVLALLCIVMIAPIAAHFGLVDHPEGRKTHAAPTPLVGGIGLFVGGVLALVVGGMINVDIRHALSGLGDYLGLIFGSVGLLTLGAIDDRTPLPAKLKLLCQLVFCCGAVFVDGVIIGDIGIHIGSVSLSLGPLVIPVTVLVMLTIINALNMIDGLDGLAAGIAASALAIIGKAVVAGQLHLEALLLCAALGATGGFLLLNFPLWPRRKARVFLGDGGTLLLGFLVAYFAVRMSALPDRVFRPSTAVWFFFIPVADAILLYIRRTLKDRAPFRPGRDHVHHVLLQRLPPWLTTWVLVGGSAVLTAGAYAAERLGTRPVFLLSGWIALFVLYGLATQRGWDEAWKRSHAPEPEADTSTSPRTPPTD